MLTECETCTAKYPPDLPRCPHCGTEGVAVPKITRLGGASSAAENPPVPDDPAPEGTAEPQPVQPPSTDVGPETDDAPSAKTRRRKETVP